MLHTRHIAQIDHAHNVVGVFTQHRHTRDAFFQKHIESLAEGGVVIHTHHVGAGHHDFPHDGVAKFEHRVQQFAVFLLQHILVSGLIHEAAQLFFTGERPTRGASRSDDAAEHNQALCNRPQHHANGPHQRGGGPENGPRMRHPDSAWRGAHDDKEHGNHDDARDEKCLPPLVDKPNHGEGDQHRSEGFNHNPHKSQRSDVARDVHGNGAQSLGFPHFFRLVEDVAAREHRERTVDSGEKSTKNHQNDGSGDKQCGHAVPCPLRN